MDQLNTANKALVYKNEKLWEIALIDSIGSIRRQTCAARLKTLLHALFFIFRQTLKIESSCFLFKQRNERGDLCTTCKHLKTLVERIWNLLTVAAISWRMWKLVKVVSLASVLFMCRSSFKYLLDDFLIKSCSHTIFAFFRLAILKMKIFRKTRNSNRCYDMKCCWSAETLTSYSVLSRNSWTFVSALRSAEKWKLTVLKRGSRFQFIWERSIVKLNVGDVAVKFECPIRFHLSIFARNTFSFYILTAQTTKILVLASY